MKVFLQMVSGLVLTLGLFLGVMTWPFFDVWAKEVTSQVVYERQMVDLTIEADGSSVEIEELTQFIRSKSVIQTASQVDIGFNSTLQKVEVLQAYTILPNGKKLPVNKDQIRIVEDDLSDGAVMFSDKKHLILIYPDVSADARLYYKIKTTSKPLFANHFQDDIYFSPFYENQQFELNVRYAVKLPLYFDVKMAKGGFVEKQIIDGKEYVHHKYKYSNKEIQPSEYAQVSYADYAPHILFSSFKNEVELGKAYAVSAKQKYAITPEIQQLANKLTQGITDPQDQAKKIYQWVSQNIRYVAIYVGDGGVVPHDANTILKNRYGDCKDYNTLLITLLSAKGIEASSAIINSGNAYGVPKVGMIYPFNHVITYISKWNIYLDATGNLNPFGNLPNDLMDKPTILAELGIMGRTPKQHPKENMVQTEAIMNIQKNGEIEGYSKTIYKGSEEIGARNTYDAYEDVKEDKMVKNHLSVFRQTGSGRFAPTDVNDLNLPFNLSTTFKLDPIANIPGAGAITIPVGLTPGKLYSMSFLQPPETPKNAFACHSRSIIENYVLNFPKNVKVTRIPENSSFETKEIYYASEYTQKDNTVKVQRVLINYRPSMVCQPKELKEIKSFLVVLKKDLRSQIFYE